MQQRQGGGVATLLDLRQAEQLVSSAARNHSRRCSSRSSRRKTRSVCLLGKNPGGIVRGRKFIEQEMPPEVPAGLPSALLERRPDIRAAEQALIAANANIGVAKAAYFPQLSLSGFLGGQSTQLSSLFSGPHSAWSFVPQVTQPIFAGGRLKSNVKLAEAERDERAGAVRKDDPDRLHRGLKRADRAPADARKPGGAGEAGDCARRTASAWPTCAIAAAWIRNSMRSTPIAICFRPS